MFKYTIHQHNAKKAGSHLDLRLQYKKQVHSFSLPKDKLPDSNNVVLAIKTHVDNNTDSLVFDGTIPDGSYGAGTLSIIETGFYNPIEWNLSDKIIFNTKNQLLNGTYYLIKTKKPNQWIFGKKK